LQVLAGKRYRTWLRGGGVIRLSDPLFLLLLSLSLSLSLALSHTHAHTQENAPINHGPPLPDFDLSILSVSRLCSRLCLDCVCHVVRFEYTFCFSFAYWTSYYLRCSWRLIPLWGCGVWLIPVWKDDKQKIYPKRTEYTWLSVNDLLNKWREQLER
jgi:hypothetical protein